LVLFVISNVKFVGEVGYRQKITKISTDVFVRAVNAHITDVVWWHAENT